MLKSVVLGSPIAATAIHFSEQLQEMATASINTINETLAIGSLPEVDLMTSFGMLAASPFALILAGAFLRLCK